MRIGYQGEPASYSHGVARELFPDADLVGLETFAGCFAALTSGEVERLVLPIENSTTGSVLPVLDRLADSATHIVAERRIEVRHSLLGVPGATLDVVERVRSHPEALAQAEGVLARHGWHPVPAHDTAGAVRQVAEAGDPKEAALAPRTAADDHGLDVLMEEVIDRDHNTTRFVVLEPGDQTIPADADKTSVVFRTAHRPGSLALALTELGLRGANLTRIESRPSEEAWTYRFFVDLIHPPGPEGLASILEPPLATVTALVHLGSYRASR